MKFKIKNIVLLCSLVISPFSYAEIIIQNTQNQNIVPNVPSINLNKPTYYEIYDPMTGKNKSVLQSNSGIAISTDNTIATLAKDVLDIFTGKSTQPTVSTNVSKSSIVQEPIELTLQNQGKTSTTQSSVQPSIIINNTPIKDDKMFTPNNLTLPKKNNEIVVVDPYSGEQKTITQKELDNVNKSIVDGKNTNLALEQIPSENQITKKLEPTKKPENTVAIKKEIKAKQDLPKSNIITSDITSFNKSSIEQYEKQSLINTNKLFEEFIKNNPSKPPMQIK